MSSTGQVAPLDKDVLPKDWALTRQGYWPKHGHSMAGTLSDPMQWRTVRDAHNQTGIPMRTLYHWVATGKLWSIRVGGSERIIFVHQHDIDAIKAERAA